MLAPGEGAGDVCDGVPLAVDAEVAASPKDVLLVAAAAAAAEPAL
jgi:hypothetical protein